MVDSGTPGSGYLRTAGVPEIAEPTLNFSFLEL
jgi:hypothetical protein